MIIRYQFYQWLFRSIVGFGKSFLFDVNLQLIDVGTYLHLLPRVEVNLGFTSRGPLLESRLFQSISCETRSVLQLTKLGSTQLRKVKSKIDAY